MMIPSENYMINNNNNNPCPFPSNNNILITMTDNNNGFFGNFPVTQSPSPFQDIFAPQPSCILGYNSTSDEAEEEHYQQPGMIDERKKRRMISNRESARRSRMRKQKHLDELCSQVMRLRMENQNLVNKLNQVAECHDRVQRENTRLKEEASDLHQMVSDLRIGSSPFSLLVADLLEDVNCNTAHLRAESSKQSMISSSSLLQ